MLYSAADCDGGSCTWWHCRASGLGGGQMLYSCHASSLQVSSFHWQLEICKHSQSACPALPCPALPCPALPCPALPCPALPCPALPCSATFGSALPCPILPCPYLHVLLQHIASEHARSHACSLQQHFHLTHNHPLSCNVMCVCV